MNNYKLTVDLSNDLMEEIERYKKNTHKQNTEDAVKELIIYALNLPIYFRNYDWKKAEDVADNEINSDKTKSFDNVEDFISDLEK
ncbi:MAG: hypothetical protein JEY97_13935 [Bacteroidales bacterium]|nr:hypothetical protein [Bacteroidales bacterium]